MSSFELILQKYSLFIIIFCLLLCIASSCIIFSVICVVIPHESGTRHIVTPDEDDIVIVVGPDGVQKLGTKISS